jgi:hypothetical protein
VLVRGTRNSVELNLFIPDDKSLSLKTIMLDALQASRKSNSILGVLTSHDPAMSEAVLPADSTIFLINPRQLPEAEQLLRSAMALRDQRAALASRPAESASTEPPPPHETASAAEPSPAPAPPKPPQIRGFIEVINAAKIAGWAFSHAAPGEALLIRAEADNGDILETRADGFRDDLRRAGFGAGNHEFVIKFPPGGPDPASRSWTVFAEAADGQRIELSRLPQPRKPASPQPAAGQAADARPGGQPVQGQSAASVGGFVERVTQESVRGWAYCPDFPAEHLDVLVSWRGELVAQSKADKFRQDLQRARIGAGDHAFVVDLPAGSIGASGEDLAVMAISTRGALAKLPIYASAFEIAPAEPEVVVNASPGAAAPSPPPDTEL